MPPHIILLPFADCKVPESKPSTALMISDGIRVHALVALTAPYKAKEGQFKLRVINVSETPVRLERAIGVPDCKFKHVPVAELDLPRLLVPPLFHMLLDTCSPCFFAYLQ